MDQEGTVVFTNSHPRTTARTHTTRRIAASFTAVTLACGFALAGATAAQAADEGPAVATSKAQFLSGSLLGTDLDNVVMLDPASASTSKSGSTRTQDNPLEATALDSINVGNGQTLDANLGQLIQLGAIGQYATAQPNGSSMAMTGAVTPDGGVTLGKNLSLPGGDATLDLNKLIGNDFAGNLAKLDLAIKAVAAQAISNGSTANGSYSLAGVNLDFTSPAVSNLTQKVDTALDSVTNRLAKLDGPDGILVGDLNNSLVKLNPALKILGGNAHLSANIDTGDLKSLVQDLLTAQYGGDGISFNLETGVVTLNLAQLAGGDLNKMAPGTDLLDPAVIDPALDSVTTKVAGIADQIVDRVRTALDNAKVTVHADVTENIAQAPLVQKVCNTVQQVVSVPTKVVQQVPTLNGLPISDTVLASLSGLLKSTVVYVSQTVTQVVDQTVDKVVCTNQTTPLPALTTSVTADISGTVNEFLTGGSIVAKASAQVLGVPIPNIDLGIATSQITDSLNTQLLGSDSAVTDLVNALNLGLVDPATQGFTDSASSVQNALTNVLSATVNNQDLTDGVFTETALIVKVLPGATGLLGGRGAAVRSARAATDSSGSAARINFAQASVGPNVKQIDTVGGVDTYPTDGTIDPAIHAAASTISRLAMTGAGITALVAAVLALLAAGAYLVRESYRRNHRPTTV